MTDSVTLDHPGPKPADAPGVSDVTVPGPPEPVPGARASHRLRTLLIGAAAYLVLSVFVWWNLWSGHPTSTTTCGCGDTSLFTWFLSWPAYAISHGLNPLYSTQMFHPTGVNLLANTSEVAIGVVLAPVTWIFGPIATLNVALTLSPFLSALAMFVLLRRWVTWSPAAFIGGLLYGFSPVILVNLVDAHLMVAMAVVPPLLVACLDELLVRQRRRPVATGILLGLLVVLQFFLGTEMLAILLVAGATAVVLIVVYAAWRHPDELRRRARHALIGLGVGAAVAVVLLAYPLWFALDGPAHLSGPVWPTLSPGLFGIGFSDLVRLNSTGSETLQAHRFGGYQGVALHQADYLGVGLIVVVVLGVLLRRRDRRLWLFGAVGAIAIGLSLTIAPGVNHFWVPWRLLRHIPVIQNILPDRFMAITLLGVSLMLGIIVDRVHGTASKWTATPLPRRPPWPAGRALTWHRVVPVTAAAVVALVALVPIASANAGNIPLTVQPVVLPNWFRTVAPHLPGGQVILSYPSSFGGFQSSLTWQAVDRMSFSLVEGGGPGGVPQRAGVERPGVEALGAASVNLDPSTAYTAATIQAVRQALVSWGVTRVVIPDQPDLPIYQQGFHTGYAVGLITAALGAGPRYQAQAWVWTVGHPIPPPVKIAPAALQSCVGTGNFPTGPPAMVPDCVLANPGAHT
ncbi:MAG: hypothetical protein ACRDWB_08885 [Acidimicrobiales bacterium]